MTSSWLAVISASPAMLAERLAQDTAAILDSIAAS